MGDDIITRLRSSGPVDDELREDASNEIARLNNELIRTRRELDADKRELTRIANNKEIEALEARLDEIRKGSPDVKKQVSKK